MAYVSRKQIIKHIEEVYERVPLNMDDRHLIAGFKAYIESLPTADVVKVKYRQWKEIRNAYGELEGWLCECGRESKIKENYCPNCGAKMDGGIRNDLYCTNGCDRHKCR